MSKTKFSADFTRDAVLQITERGYPVSDVSQQLWVSSHSLCAWKKKFWQLSSGDDKGAVIRRLKRELSRVSEARSSSRTPEWQPPSLGQTCSHRC